MTRRPAVTLAIPARAAADRRKKASRRIGARHHDHVGVDIERMDDALRVIWSKVDAPFYQVVLGAYSGEL
jgi:hypothetical protein